MVLGAVIDDKGQPICCEMWPGNTTDVKTLLPIVAKLQKLFNIVRIYIVADRGIIGAETLRKLENPENTIPYILGTRKRKVKEIRDVVFSHPGRYKEVRAETADSKDPEPLKVKQLQHNGHRYIVCCNPRQALKEARDWEVILAAPKEQIKKKAKSLVGNKVYRKYLKIAKDSVIIMKTRFGKNPDSTASGCL